MMAPNPIARFVVSGKKPSSETVRQAGRPSGSAKAKTKRRAAKAGANERQQQRDARESHAALTREKFGEQP